MNESSQPSKTPGARRGITIRALLLGIFFAGLFAYATVMRENVAPSQITTATQIAVFPFLLLIGALLMVNPLIKRVLPFLRPFSVAELMIVFVMGAVSSGISTFGLASQLVPIVSSLMNPYWNNDQSRWDIHVEPFVNDEFFIAQEQTQEAARDFRQVHMTLRSAQSILGAAKTIDAARSQAESAQGALAKARELPEGSNKKLKVNAARKELRFARRAIEQAEDLWQPYSREHDVADVIAQFPQRIEQLKAERAAIKAHLDDIEDDAEAKVELFRTGLPDELRAIPGFLYVKGEGIAAYRARVARLLKGVKALEHVRKAETILAERGMNSGTGTSGTKGEPVEKAVEHLAKAVEKLAFVSRDAALSKRLEQAQQQLRDLNEELHETRQHLSALRQRRRVAPSAYFAELDKQIKHAEKAEERLTEDQKKLAERIKTKIEPQLEVVERVRETQGDLEDIRDRVLAADSPAALQGLSRELGQAKQAFRTFDASFQRFFLGDVDWGAWVRPLLLWSALVVLTYLVLMTFNVLIFRQWAYNERLIYPLAELPMLLAGDEDTGTGEVPPMFRNGLFWVGVAISAFVVGWNLVADKNTSIPMTFSLTDYVKGTVFEGITPGAQLHVFFTLIGLSFLIPARISHSLWAFHLGYMGLLLVLVWMGFGVNESSFPADWLLVLNFRTAVGGGALTMFALIVLWKCRTYLFCFVNPVALEGLPDDERRELRISSWLFVGGSIGLIAMLTVGLGANLFFAILCYAIILIITVGLVRAVTEGGILGFQCWFGPFHFIRSVFGMNHSWSAPTLFAPLVIFYSIMFLDIKTFIAPAMANALKIRDDAGMGRLRFHVGIAAGILIAMVVAILTHVILGYHQGADTMHGWFYSDFPKQVFDTIKTMAITEPTDSAGGKWWLLSGGIIMALLIYFRQRVFWLPHPIGLIMFVNPLMGIYWFSIFLGWVFKTAVTKYGNKATYANMRMLFIGLIVGELIMCLFGATLNRV